MSSQTAKQPSMLYNQLPEDYCKHFYYQVFQLLLCEPLHQATLSHCTGGTACQCLARQSVAGTPCSLTASAKITCQCSSLTLGSSLSYPQVMGCSTALAARPVVKTPRAQCRYLTRDERMVGAPLVQILALHFPWQCLCLSTPANQILLQ